MEKSKRAYWDAVEANEGKIDPEKHGIGMTGMNGSPSASLNGKELYRRISFAYAAGGIDVHTYRE